jgi:SPP1 gp7 family putative phage head morphogenesis protein
MKNLKLTKKRSKWASNRSSAKLVGKRLASPSGPAERYQKVMQNMIGLMVRDYLRELKPISSDLDGRTMDSLFGDSSAKLNALSKKWRKRFADSTQSWVSRFIGQVDSFSQKNTESSLKELSGGLTIKTPDMPVAMLAKLQAAKAANVALIKTVPAQFHAKIEGAVMRSIQQGGEGAKTIYDEIVKTGQVTNKRAAFIARDQTSKAVSAFNTERMQSAGVKQFEWGHSGGGVEPRDLHLRLDGQIFSFDDLPVIDERTGERGLPGQLINCRCFMVPVIVFDED